MNTSKLEHEESKPRTRWVIIYPKEVLYLFGAYRNKQEVIKYCFSLNFSYEKAGSPTIRRVPLREYHEIDDDLRN